MKVGIIEDEALSAKRLIAMIKHYDPSIQIQFIVDSNKKLQQQLQNCTHPDLLFSDIELLDGEVFQSYQMVEPSCPIIFTTAFDNFWLKAFQENGISYLLKPFDQEQLAQSINKYYKLKSTNTKTSTLPFNELDSDKKRKEILYKKRFVVKRFDGIEILATTDINLVRIEVSGVCAFDQNGKSYPLSESSLTQLMSKLDPCVFFQINRNEIISIDSVVKVVPENKDRLSVKVNGFSTNLIVSAQRTPDFRAWLDT